MLKKSKIFLLLFLLFLPFLFSFAQETELEYPAFPGIPAWQGTLADFFRYLYQILLGIGILLSFGFFIYGGLLYFLSFGYFQRRRRAKEIIFSSLLGLFILFASYVILSAIDPALVIWDIQIISFELPRLQTLPSPVIREKMGCKEIPIGKTFKAIHKLEREALLIAGMIEDLLFGTSGDSKLIEIIEEIRKLTEQCRCENLNLQPICLAPDSGCPECPAICPPSTEDPCPPGVRDQINQLLEELEDLGIETEEDLISLLEEKIRLLAKVRLDFQKQWREARQCVTEREYGTNRLLTCAQVRAEGLVFECKELDLYCCP